MHIKEQLHSFLKCICPKNNVLEMSKLFYSLGTIKIALRLGPSLKISITLNNFEQEFTDCQLWALTTHGETP